ncbi:hypothetical protein [Spiroplasma endosymbiont of Glossina fuscipes fuscipes]|uniref:hypothetical protein n=1 Tax=Spiroplasma endosymbiont of Glossina fuscipes fuscipes TaxID=2004463 RepID=UPI003C73D3E5
MNLLTSWDDAFNVVIDIFMKIMDWMWTLKLPATDIPLYVLWIIGGILGIVMRLVGSAPQLSTMSQNTKQAAGAIGKIKLGINETDKEFSKKRKK